MLGVWLLVRVFTLNAQSSGFHPQHHINNQHNPNTWEIEAKESEVQSHPLLFVVFEDSMGYRRCCLNKRKVPTWPALSMTHQPHETMLRPWCGPTASINWTLISNSRGYSRVKKPIVWDSSVQENKTAFMGGGAREKTQGLEFCA